MPLYKEPCPLPNASCSTLYSPPGSRKIPVFSRGANLPTPRRQRRFQRIFRYLRNFLEGSPTICFQKKTSRINVSVPRKCTSVSAYPLLRASTARHVQGPHISASRFQETTEPLKAPTGGQEPCQVKARTPRRSPARLPWERTLNTKRLAGPMRSPAVPDRQE